MDKGNAEKGDKHERLFSNSLKNLPELIAILIDYFGYTGVLAKSYPTGPAGGKADVIISFTDGNHLTANIKSFGKVGVNQAARGTVQSFVDNCNLEAINQILVEGVVRKAKKGRLVLEEDEPVVHDAVSASAQKLVQFALGRLERPKLLVLYDNVREVMHLYDLEKLLKEMSYEVTFSDRGNIMIGESILLHRKGGDGNVKRFEKIDPRHPGNNLAVKLLCKKFIGSYEPIVTYEPLKRK